MGIIENGFYKEVHPTFLYESICTLIIFILLMLVRNKRKFKGNLCIIYIVLYSLARAIIEPLRTDSLKIYGDIRISMIISIILLIIFIPILIYKYFIVTKK